MSLITRIMTGHTLVLDYGTWSVVGSYLPFDDIKSWIQIRRPESLEECFHTFGDRFISGALILVSNNLSLVPKYRKYFMTDVSASYKMLHDYFEEPEEIKKEYIKTICKDPGYISCYYSGLFFQVDEVFSAVIDNYSGPGSDYIRSVFDKYPELRTLMGGDRRKNMLALSACFRIFEGLSNKKHYIDSIRQKIMDILDKISKEYWPGKEPIIDEFCKSLPAFLKECPEIAYRHYRMTNHSSDIFYIVSKDALCLAKYIIRTQGRRMDEYEEFIFKCPRAARKYCQKLIKYHIPEVYETVKKDPVEAYKYCKYILRGPDEELLEYIRQDAASLIKYNLRFSIPFRDIDTSKISQKNLFMINKIIVEIIKKDREQIPEHIKDYIIKRKQLFRFIIDNVDEDPETLLMNLFPESPQVIRTILRRYREKGIAIILGGTDAARRTFKNDPKCVGLCIRITKKITKKQLRKLESTPEGCYQLTLFARKKIKKYEDMIKSDPSVYKKYTKNKRISLVFPKPEWNYVDASYCRWHLDHLTERQKAINRHHDIVNDYKVSQIIKFVEYLAEIYSTSGL